MRNLVMLQAERARLLRRMLERHAAELVARKHELRELCLEGAEAVEDLESSVLRECRGLGAAVASISSRTVQLIESALRRLQAGTYGRCSDCARRIPWARLHALPFADTCRDCQERRDHRGGAFPILA